jgi:hypothetical protein
MLKYSWKEIVEKQHYEKKLIVTEEEWEKNGRIMIYE